MRLIKILTFIALIFFASVSSAWAGLLITPTILVFGPKDRFASVTLVNSGDKISSYNMKLIYFSVAEDTGSYTLTENVDGVDIREYLVFSPRRVTLKPGEKQKLRIALKRPAELPDGDYRAHLRFEVDDEEADGDVQAASGAGISGEAARASAQVKVKVNYSIPVVVRSGAESDLGVEIGQVSFSRDPENGALNLLVPISKTNLKRSLISYMKVYNVVSGKRVLVSELSNANIFEGVSRRSFQVPVKQDIVSGTLEVVLENFDKTNPFEIVRKEFPLGN